MPGSHRGTFARRGLSDPLELGLQMTVSHRMGAGDQTQNLCKINKCLQLRSHLQPLSEFLNYDVQAKSKASGYLPLSVPVESFDR